MRMCPAPCCFSLIAPHNKGEWSVDQGFCSHLSIQDEILTGVATKSTKGHPILEGSDSPVPVNI